MTAAPVITRIGTTKDQLGESPVWDVRTQSLYWIDAMAGLIRRLTPATKAVEEFQVPPPLGSMALRSNGGAILALRHGFARYDFASRTVTARGSIGRGDPLAPL